MRESRRYDGDTVLLTGMARKTAIRLGMATTIVTASGMRIRTGEIDTEVAIIGGGVMRRP